MARRLCELPVLSSYRFLVVLLAVHQRGDAGMYDDRRITSGDNNRFAKKQWLVQYPHDIGYRRALRTRYMLMFMYHGYQVDH